MIPAIFKDMWIILRKPRFPFWRILLIISIIYLLLWSAILGISIYTPKELRNESFKGLEHMMTLRALLELVYAAFFNCLFFYTALNIYYRAVILKKQPIAYIVYSLAFLGILLLSQKLSMLCSPETRAMAKYQSNVLILIGYSFICCFYTVIIFVFIRLAVSTDQKQRNRELLEQNSKLELEKLKAEYNFLKAQINPHFLHNSLNFLYAKSLPFSEELSEGILTISEIMRYALLNDTDSDGRVLLNKELEHIRNIIKMNQLRFDNKLNIQMEITGTLAGIKILPLILITITENAFKHGDIRNEKVPLTIRLQVEEDNIYFTCSNKKKSGPKELSFGIGLNNTRKRLKMVYGEKAVLEIKDSSDIYEIILKIPVSND